VAAVRDNLLGYTRLLRAHIGKEDNVLYPMAERILTPEDQQWLAEEFDRVEAEEMGAGVHEKYHQMAHELAGGGK
jgi:hemerythrin-like domain-containing protein